MPELNKANRQVCDVDIRFLNTMAPFIDFDTANTTTTGLSGDSVYAMAKGSRRIAFPNPIQGTMSIEAQVYPFKFFALFSDGVIETNAAYAETKVITASAGGSLAIPQPSGGTIKTGTVFVYPEDRYGDEDAAIAGTYAEGTFTATTASDITASGNYKVGYIVARTAGVKKIPFNNKKLPRDYFITQKTLDKDEQGVLTPFVMTAYKATIQRSFDLSFSSEGDPASVTMTFDLMEDKDGNILDMIELTEDAMDTSISSLSIVKGGASPDIRINNAYGTVTAAVTDSNDDAYAKVKAIISGDNDTLIISADSDAAAGTYTVTLTDSTVGGAQSTSITVTVTAA